MNNEVDAWITELSLYGKSRISKEQYQEVETEFSKGDKIQVNLTIQLIMDSLAEWINQTSKRNELLASVLLELRKKVEKKLIGAINSDETKELRKLVGLK